MPVLPKLIHRFNAVLIKIPGGCFAEFDKLILKFIWQCKGSEITKSILKKKKSKITRFMLSDFKIYYKAKIIKTVWY